MYFFQIMILAVIQGFTELLPVSSSAHVIMAERLMGMDPTAPSMTLMLVMLHTGTMFAVIFYFWKKWKAMFFKTRAQSLKFGGKIAVATLATALVGLGLKAMIEKTMMQDVPNAEIEMIFGNTNLICLSLACAGLFILFADYWKKRHLAEKELGLVESLWIGMTQGLCLPFRGFSRSGATISAGLVLDLSKAESEDFSFALAVVLTPLVVGRELHRFLQSIDLSTLPLNEKMGIFLPSLAGMTLSFAAGLLALQWLSHWLDEGRWSWFGLYCLAASAGVWFIR